MELELNKQLTNQLLEENYKMIILGLKTNLELLLEFFKVQLIELKDRMQDLDLILILEYLKSLETKKYQYTKLLEISFIFKDLVRGQYKFQFKMQERNT